MQSNAEEPADFVKDIRKMSADFDGWYTDVVRKAELADWTGIRGMMVVRPYGWGVWENIQRAFDDLIKSSGHENWAFPLLIPDELFSKEAEHVEGFAPESIWVNYVASRPLRRSPAEWGPEDTAQAAEGWLPQPLVIRPTSETIIGPIVKRYIHSHRDLPLLTNQWGNVLRWEKRPRLLLRSVEFFWQEGHTFHASAEEAEKEVHLILEYYRQVAEEWCAIPVLTGRKSEAEKFAGAVYTTSIEAMMRDGLALQAGTSHFLGQNFSRAYDIAFTDRTNRLEHCFTTSWGMSTRMVGGIVMAHGDDSGLILPPKVAPLQVVIVPIFRTAEERAQVEAFLDHVLMDLRGNHIRHRVDWRDDMRPGEKFAHWELRGVPLRLEVGPKDVAARQVTVVDRLTREKQALHAQTAGGVGHNVIHHLEDFQARLFKRALDFRAANSVEVRTLAELLEAFQGRSVFASAPWCLDAACEARVKEETGGVTTRNYREGEAVEGECLVCGRPASVRVVFARSY